MSQVFKELTTAQIERNTLANPMARETHLLSRLRVYETLTLKARIEKDLVSESRRLTIPVSVNRTEKMTIARHLSSNRTESFRYERVLESDRNEEVTVQRVLESDRNEPVTVDRYYENANAGALTFQIESAGVETEITSLAFEVNSAVGADGSSIKVTRATDICAAETIDMADTGTVLPIAITGATQAAGVFTVTLTAAGGATVKGWLHMVYTKKLASAPHAVAIEDPGVGYTVTAVRLTLDDVNGANGSELDVTGGTAIVDHTAGAANPIDVADSGSTMSFAIVNPAQAAGAITATLTPAAGAHVRGTLQIVYTKTLASAPHAVELENPGACTITGVRFTVDTANGADGSTLALTGGTGAVIAPETIDMADTEDTMTIAITGASQVAGPLTATLTPAAGAHVRGTIVVEGTKTLASAAKVFTLDDPGVGYTVTSVKFKPDIVDGADGSTLLLEGADDPITAAETIDQADEGTTMVIAITDAPHTTGALTATLTPAAGANVEGTLQVELTKNLAGATISTKLFSTAEAVTFTGVKFLVDEASVDGNVVSFASDLLPVSNVPTIGIAEVGTVVDCGIANATHAAGGVFRIDAGVAAGGVLRGTLDITYTVASTGSALTHSMEYFPGKFKVKAVRFLADAVTLDNHEVVVSVDSTDVCTLDIDAADAGTVVAGTLGSTVEFTSGAIKAVTTPTAGGVIKGTLQVDYVLLEDTTP